MRIFDCFMYFDEDVVLDLRLNTLNDDVDYFVIVESNFTHKGDRRSLKFDYKNFPKFRDKIIYLIYDKKPKKLENIDEKDSHGQQNRKYIFNAIHRENGQRNFIAEGLKIAEDDDLILISDVDEIPNLKNINLKNFKERLIFFNQEMFYYKFNLKLPDYNWVGTKSCKKKYLKSPQWLRNIKDKKYSFYRIDTIFSKKKYTNLKVINDGGWHFTNIKTPKMIRHKFKSYLHHFEFDQTNVVESDIENFIKKKQAIYNLKVDKRGNKVGNGETLENFDIKKLPIYIQHNLEKYKDWID